MAHEAGGSEKREKQAGLYLLIGKQPGEVKPDEANLESCTGNNEWSTR
jgi:hypothetical protein